LIAASVWMALMYERPEDSPATTGRLSAETIPEVTVLDRPSGAPTAMTSSPTTTDPGSPRGSGGRSARDVARTATSYAGSVPTTVASRRVPSPRTTTMEVPTAATT
jgi:hypothetical protein